MGDDVGRTARRLGDSPWLERAARVGYAVNGLMHLVIAWLVAALALGRSEGTTDQSGALQTLSGTPMGGALLVVMLVGFAGLALWQIADAAAWPGASHRAKAASKGIVYALLAVTALTFVRGGSTSSSGQTVDVTAQLMSQPAGTILVGAVGAAVIGVGIYHVPKGVTKGFLEDLQGHPGGVAVTAGRVGYAVKGLALIVVGILFVVAAVRHNAGAARGLDGATRTLLQYPYGVALTLLVAAGFLAYAVYSFFRARYAKV